MSKKIYDYFWARSLSKITGVIFFTQLFVELSGMITRKPEFWWVIYACLAAFVASIIYTLVLVLLNARNRYLST